MEETDNERKAACGPRNSMGRTWCVCAFCCGRTMGSMLLPAGCFMKQNKRYAVVNFVTSRPRPRPRVLCGERLKLTPLISYRTIRAHRHTFTVTEVTSAHAHLTVQSPWIEMWLVLGILPANTRHFCCVLPFPQILIFLASLRRSKILHACNKPECSLTCSQKSATGHYPEPIKSSPHPHTLFLWHLF
jgi:hypothetical protein